MVSWERARLGWRVVAWVVVVWVLCLTLRPERVSYGVNLVPLSQHLPALRAVLRGGRHAEAAVHFLVVNVLGNMALFFPLGLTLAGALGGSRRRRFAMAVGSAAALSVSIELVQLGLPSRTTDVDDVIFNTLGAAVGAATFLVLEGRFRGR